MASSIGEDTPKGPPEDDLQQHEPESNSVANHGDLERATSTGKTAGTKQSFSIGATVAHPGDSVPTSPAGEQPTAKLSQLCSYCYSMSTIQSTKNLPASQINDALSRPSCPS